MDKQNVVYPYNVILLSHNKEYSADTCPNLGEPQKYYTKRKKPIKNSIFYVMLLILKSIIGISINRKSVSGCLELGWGLGHREMIDKGYSLSFEERKSSEIDHGDANLVCLHIPKYKITIKLDDLN